MLRSRAVFFALVRGRLLGLLAFGFIRLKKNPLNFKTSCCLIKFFNYSIPLQYLLLGFLTLSKIYQHRGTYILIFNRSVAELEPEPVGAEFIL